MPPSLSAPVPGLRYRIGLCTGETQTWEFLGVDARSFEWWRNTESGREFSNASLMYAWWIIEEQPEGPAAE